jgi:hypothetical protein
MAFKISILTLSKLVEQANITIEGMILNVEQTRVKFLFKKNKVFAKLIYLFLDLIGKIDHVPVIFWWLRWGSFRLISCQTFE